MFWFELFFFITQFQLEELRLKSKIAEEQRFFSFKTFSPMGSSFIFKLQHKTSNQSIQIKLKGRKTRLCFTKGIVTMNLCFAKL